MEDSCLEAIFLLVSFQVRASECTSMSAFNESLLHYYLIGHRGRLKPGPTTQSKPRELGLKARTTCFVPTSAGIPAILAEETRFFSARIAA